MSQDHSHRTPGPQQEFDRLVQEPGRDRMFTVASKKDAESPFYDPMKSGHHQKPGKSVRKS